MNYKDWLDNKANELRNSPTIAEQKVKKYLDEHKIRYKSQVPIMVDKNKGYIVDFLLFNNVVLEVDGSVHFTEEAKESDKQRTKDLESKGYKVIRMNNKSTSASNIERVLISRFNKVQPQVAERLKREAEKKKRSDKWKNYQKYKSRLPDWNFKERIWDLSGGHYN